MRLVRPAITLGAAVVVAACSRDRSAPTVPEFLDVDLTAALSSPSAPVPLALRTYDGSGQAVHPDFVAPGAPWPNRLFYLAITPYPGGDTRYENPSLYAGVDGVTWGGAPRAPVPLVRPQTGYLSDPDILHDPSRNELFLYYRQSSDFDRIYLIRSPNGWAWTKPSLVVTGAPSQVISPAIVRVKEGEWMMWSVNAGPGCYGSSTTVELRRSSDGLAWSAPQAVNLPIADGRFAWHLDVQWIAERHEFWALFPVKTPGTCATTALFIGRSANGVDWNVEPSPVLVIGTIPEFSDIVYRSTFAYDASADEITFWYSGARLVSDKPVWRTAVQQRARADVFSGSRGESAEVPAPSRAVSAHFDPP